MMNSSPQIAPHPAVARPGQGRLISILALLTSFGPLATDTYLSALPDIRFSLKASASATAATLSVFFFGLAAGQLVYGPLSDRFGRRGPLLAGTGVFTLASLCIALVPDIQGMIALRLIQSLGGACGLTLARAVVRDLYDAGDLARAFAALTLIGMIAPLIAPLLGTAIIMVAGWRAVFAMLTLMGLATLAAICFGLPETLPPERRHRDITAASILEAFTRLLSHARFTLASLISGSAAGTLFAFITGSPGAFMSGFGLDKPHYTALFSAVTVAMLVGGAINRRLAGRYDSTRLLTFGLSMNAALGMAMLGAPLLGAWGVGLCLGGMVLMLGFILPNSATVALARLQRDAGSASSLLGVVQFGCGFLVSSAVAWGQNGTAWPMALAMAFCGAWGRMCWWLWGKAEEKE
ncbi:multidrug effflux MFS transporter [Novosphingobium rosa]|uniref:multidrug effflux MFS transporter n=1 Tax=Novosphingobium rosa TaxID=76978 RepID=UPI0014722AD4|nr:multidrug effflux MFS transporter [Novosphingobium rosa]